MYTHNDIAEWLSPKSRSSLIDAIYIQITSETKERLIRNTGSNIDYGYSFPGLNDTKVSCLKDVRQHYENTKKRAKVLDIGAGFGSMTWKLLTAGAEVDAFEIQAPTAAELASRIRQMNPYFWEEDNLDEILHIFPENALVSLLSDSFTEKYDFIWISQVLHFLTPIEVQKLSVIFQRILKPGGKIFAESNCIISFNSIDPEHVLQHAYENAKQKNLPFPGFLAINASTLINKSINKVVDQTFINTYDQEEMQRFNIPLQVNAYGANYLGPIEINYSIDKFVDTRRKYPSDHIFVINRFHQVMNFLDEETIKSCFGHSDNDCDCYILDHNTNIKISPSSSSYSSPGCLMTFVVRKKPILLAQEQVCSSRGMNMMFRDSLHNQLLLEIETKCIDKTSNASLISAVASHNYGLALRKACAVGNLEIVKSILKYNLNFNINEKSSSNNFTALDWINSTKKVDFMTKERIINLLLKHNAESGINPSSDIVEDMSLKKHVA